MNEIQVLNHGHVRLVEAMGSDLTIVRSARVSYNADWRTGEDEGKDTKLIHYLMKNRHTTPFESVAFTFEIKAPIFVFRQWHRHRTWSYNEISARYSELPEEFYIPDPSLIGEQSASSKQARVITPEGGSGDERSYEVDAYQKNCQQSFSLYKDLLSSGWPRELARACLPVSTYSKMFATVNLHNLFHFLKLRLDPHAQYEIRVYAEAILRLIHPVVPVAVEAWKEHVMSNMENA